MFARVANIRQMLDIYIGFFLREDTFVVSFPDSLICFPSNKIVVSDPCYDSLNACLDGIKTGVYYLPFVVHAEKSMGGVGDLARTACSGVMYYGSGNAQEDSQDTHSAIGYNSVYYLKGDIRDTSVMTVASKLQGVDSGQLGYFDHGFFHMVSDEEREKNTTKMLDWYDEVCPIFQSDAEMYKRLYRWHYTDHSFVASTGWGDGTYKVHYITRNEDERLQFAMADFNIIYREDEDREYEDDEYDEDE